jgi:RNA-binding protein 39
VCVCVCVCVCVQRKREADEVTRDARTVFVSSLVVRATEQNIKSFFEAVGRVKDVQLIKDKSGKSKGFGYVEFAELDSVPQALVLNGRNFCMKHPGCTCSGLPVMVKPSEAEKNYEAAAQTSVAQLSSRLFVGNLPGDAYQSELKVLMMLRLG